MLKSRGAMIGIAAALVASALLFAGLTMTATTGAATDGFPGGAPQGPLTAPDNGTTPSNPPASEFEQPGAGTGADPTQPNTGNQAGAGAAPSLPNAGSGMPANDNGLGTLVVLLGIAGAALVGAGAKAAADRKN